ncbi:MAG: hypothetical protein K8W52_18165 [Deltaproteobacteria bacterium]|nr:hypothetical protein [Deltaproteobacteria bacterium]
MRPVRVVVAALAIGLAGVAAGCGSEIGDSCSTSDDCNAGTTSGGRACDPGGGGYCTIIGCDYDSCPSEATCVRFFTGSFQNRTCNPQKEDLPASDGTDDCSADELCELDGHCVTRTSELRYCMRTCSDNSDCRDGFECRDLALMKAHGGEPVPEPGTRLGDNPQRFCAVAPSN